MLGNVIWAKSAGGNQNDEAFAIATDDNGNILVAGAFYSSMITFGSTTLTSVVGGDVFLVKLNSATGIESIENDARVNIYPNPSNGKYIIEMNNIKGLAETGAIEVYNIMGAIIFNAEFQQFNDTSIDISEQPNGIYFLTIVSDKGRRTIKVLKH